MWALLRQAVLIDFQEDAKFGKDKRGDELPEELQRRNSQLEWISKAKAELEAEAAAAGSSGNEQARLRAAHPVTVRKDDVSAAD
jgi:hypothetical protein